MQRKAKDKIISWLFLSLLASLIYVILFNAWVGDDAYITFRVIDNFINGYGLRWNIDERVQVYTHPLWMLLHIPFYWLFGNIYLVTIALSILCAASAIIIAIRTFPHRYEILMITVLLPLILSNSFIHYSTSGLENPLSFLLFTIFGWVLLRLKHNRLFWLCLIAALAALNRMDTILIYLPMLAFLSIRQGFRRSLKPLFLGFLPLLAWLVFALFYYGFIFPNTKYAKLNTGIATADYIIQGFYYLYDLIMRDLNSAFLLLIPVFILAYGARKKIPAEIALIAAGCLLYCLYIIYIGGDFMSGRFWSLPVFITAWLLCSTHKTLLPGKNLYAFAVMLIIFKLLSFTFAFHVKESYAKNRISGICDERDFYLRVGALFRPIMGFRTNMTFTPKLKRVTESKKNVLVFGSVGLRGFYLADTKIIIDRLALCDPLLARLPAEDAKRWRVGHYKRLIPTSYKEGRITGNFDNMQPDLRAYYKPLRYIISGNLWEWERIKTIMKFNLGQYDESLKNYLINYISGNDEFVSEE